jgi:hypothetical protein
MRTPSTVEESMTTMERSESGESTFSFSVLQLIHWSSSNPVGAHVDGGDVSDSLLGSFDNETDAGLLHRTGPSSLEAVTTPDTAPSASGHALDPYILHPPLSSHLGCRD